MNRRSVLGGAAAGAVALTGRREAAPPPPPPGGSPPPRPHLVEAQYLVDYLRLAESPAGNNVYKRPDEANIVTWGAPGRVADFRVQAQCASFVTAVLQRTYPWATDAFFLTHFGAPSPFARDYARVLGTGGVPHFTRLDRVTDLQPGDLIAIDYRNEQDTNTGHIGIVRRVRPPDTAPASTLNFPGEVQYPVEIVDCTSDPHGMHGVGNYESYPDSRLAPGVTNDGAGYGTMMVYGRADSGFFSRYRWSVNTSSTGVYRATERPVVAARVSA
jgi:hypothetical protein